MRFREFLSQAWGLFVASARCLTNMRKLQSRSHGWHEASWPPSYAAVHAGRVTVEITAGDLIVVPAGTPHYVRQLEDSIATSINFVDGTRILYFRVSKAA